MPIVQGSSILVLGYIGSRQQPISLTGEGHYACGVYGRIDGQRRGAAHAGDRFARGPGDGRWAGHASSTYFLDVLAFVKEARLAGGKVLVHCRHGVNRSATVVIAYVMTHMDWSLVDAYLYVRSRHLHVILQPHLLFFWDLMGWERFLVQATGPSAYAHGPPMPRPTPILVLRSMLPHPHAKSTVLVTGPSAPFVHSRSYVLDRPQLSACLPRTPPDNLHLKN